MHYAYSETSESAQTSVLGLLQEIVRIPTQGGQDDLDEILRYLKHWLEEHGAPAQLLQDDARRNVAVVSEIGKGPKTYCLDACVDTAPFGDRAGWDHDPTGAEIVDGHLYGRGAADSKAAVAIFAHLAVHFAHSNDLAGRLLVLFDGDEHSGAFAGIKAFLRTYPDVDGVMIGYPGNERVVIGSRGFYRAAIRLYGRGGHSGGRRHIGVNAVSKAAKFIAALDAAELPGPTDDRFPLHPSITVTGISGGSSFSMIPDVCEVRIDSRLTPYFDRDDAKRLVRRLAAATDKEMPGRTKAEIDEVESWPAYRLDDNESVAQALDAAASEAKNAHVPFAVSGPSNVGNFLAAHSVPATCGFGATYTNIHAPNESVEISSLPMVYDVYRQAVRSLLS